MYDRTGTYAVPLSALVDLLVTIDEQGRVDGLAVRTYGGPVEPVEPLLRDVLVGPHGYPVRDLVEPLKLAIDRSWQGKATTPTMRPAAEGVEVQHGT